MAPTDSSSCSPDNQPDPRRLSRSEERELIAAAQQIGDKKAYAQLVDAYYPKLLREATRLANGDQNLAQDLAQEGVIGFVRAIREFDLSWDNRLWTFASFRVENAMYRLLRQPLTEHGFKRRRKILDTQESLRQRYRREPTIDEIAQELGLPRTVVQVYWNDPRHSSLPLLDDIEEQDSALHHVKGVVLGTDRHAIDDQIIMKEEFEIKSNALLKVLCNDKFAKVTIIAILREAKEFSCTELQVLALLSRTDSEAKKQWKSFLESNSFLALRNLPATWEEVVALFRTPPPILNKDSLRQWYGRNKRALVRALEEHCAYSA